MVYESKDMDYKNYFKLKKFSLLYDHYVIIDTVDYLADGVFFQNKITVDFGTEFVKNDGTYRFIACKTRKRDRLRFLDAMERLKEKMLICGYADYPEFCADVQNTMIKMRDEDVA